MMLILLLAALAAGTANPFQSGANAELNKHLSQPVWTGLVVYGTGLAGLLVAQLILRRTGAAGGFTAVPWWAWMGGLISLVPTLIGLTIAQRMGSGLFTGVSITAALFTSVAVDHYGLAGFTRHTASPMRMVGCGLMIAGVWAIARF